MSNCTSRSCAAVVVALVHMVGYGGGVGLSSFLLSLGQARLHQVILAVWSFITTLHLPVIVYGNQRYATSTNTSNQTDFANISSVFNFTVTETPTWTLENSTINEVIFGNYNHNTSANRNISYIADNSDYTSLNESRYNVVSWTYPNDTAVADGDWNSTESTDSSETDSLDELLSLMRTEAIVLALLVFCALSCLAAILLFSAICTHFRVLMLPWIVLQWCSLFIYIALLGVLTWQLVLSEALLGCWWLLVAAVAVLGLLFLCLLVVTAAYQEQPEQREDSFELAYIGVK